MALFLTSEEALRSRARCVEAANQKHLYWMLNTSRYVLLPLRVDIPLLPDAVRDFKAALVRCRKAEDNLRQVMQVGGWLEEN